MPEAKLALYREWRPATFSEVVGQDLIVAALKQAVRRQEIAHAYLFCGTRGTGKTSLAKIFSRAVNCPCRDEEGNPCNQCEVCRSILDANLLDVVEMDAASNNGVDDIRRIIEEVSYRPALAKYKVYIIDEAHMLSTAAFNALLKTLEEPPAHVIFILATTDPQRLPATIHSRCQRYDFRRIGEEEMRAHLRTIADDISLPIDEDALKAICRLSDGAMRDAISLLDQCRAIYHTKKQLHSDLGDAQKITREDIMEMSGQVSDRLLLSLMTAVCRAKPLPLCRVLDEVSAKGMDYGRFCLDLALFYRHLLLLKSGGAAMIPLLPVPEETAQTLMKYLPFYQETALIQLVEKLGDLAYRLKSATEPRLTAELALLGLMTESKLFIQEAQREKAALAARDTASAASASSDPVPVPGRSEAPASDAEDSPSEEAISFSSSAPPDSLQKKSGVSKGADRHTDAQNGETSAAGASDTPPASETKAASASPRSVSAEAEAAAFSLAPAPFESMPRERGEKSLSPDDPAVLAREKEIAAGKSYAAHIPPKRELPSYAPKPSGFAPYDSASAEEECLDAHETVPVSEELEYSPSPGDDLYIDAAKIPAREASADATSVRIPYGLGLTRAEKEAENRVLPRYVEPSEIWPDRFAPSSSAAELPAEEVSSPETSVTSDSESATVPPSLSARSEHRTETLSEEGRDVFRPTEAAPAEAESARSVSAPPDFGPPDLSPEEAEKAWRKILQDIGKSDFALRLILEQHPWKYESGRFCLFFDEKEKMVYNKISNSSSRQLCTRVLRTLFPEREFSLDLRLRSQDSRSRAAALPELAWVLRAREICARSGVPFEMTEHEADGAQETGLPPGF